MKRDLKSEARKQLRLSWLRYFSIAFFFFVSIFVFSPFQMVFSQSGRSQQPSSKKQPPSYPRPKIHDGEDSSQQKNDSDAIRINSDLVNVVVSVARENASLPDLKQEDFEISENGVPQEIANFSRTSDQPLKLIMLFDTSTSVAPTLEFERRAASRFFERVLRPQDRASIFSVSTDVIVLQDFTNRTSALINATRQLEANGSTSLYDGIFLAADYIKKAIGRRVIVIVSDGGDTTSGKSLLDALGEVQKSDAVIFAIFTGNPYHSQNLRDQAAESALETLTRETGGILLKPRVDPHNPHSHYTDETEQISLQELDRSFTELAEQLSIQYVLGFYSTNEKRDGSFRKLSVRIKKTGYQARARTGYYAPTN